MKFCVAYFLVLFFTLCNAANGCTSNEYEPYPGDCSKFYKCDNGQLVEYSCESDMEWNDDTKACDDPENVDCDDSDDSDTSSEVPTTSSSQSNNGQFKVVCYFTNWSFYRSGAGKYVPEDIDPKLCTHIIYAFAILDPTSLTIKIQDPYVDIDNKLYQRITAYKQKGIKVLIAVGGGSDSIAGKYGRLLSDAKARTNFIKNAIIFVEKYNFDGIDLDFEFPACWQGDCQPSRSKEKDDFTQLATEMYKAFKSRGLLLSAAVSNDKNVIDAAYDILKLSQNLDWISIMEYDYHGSWDGKTGHNSPLYLYPGDQLNTLNCNFTTHYWIQRGATPSKLVMGLGSYGQTFTLKNSQNNGIYAPTTGPGKGGPFTQSNGTFAYYEICDKTKKNGWKVVRDSQNRIGPYAFSGDQWTSYDDIQNVRVKAKYIRSLKLAGGMMWSLDFDDFKGKCGCGKNPFLTALNQELRGIGGTVVNNCT